MYNTITGDRSIKNLEKIEAKMAGSKNFTDFAAARKSYLTETDRLKRARKVKAFDEEDEERIAPLVDAIHGHMAHNDTKLESAFGKTDYIGV